MHRENGQTLTALCEHVDMTRQDVTQDLQQLEDANLVAIVWQGRENLHYLNPVPLQEILERWIGKIRTPSPSGVERFEKGSRPKQKQERVTRWKNQS
jgi:DNA-binding transcriptional ArsR family regulator